MAALAARGISSVQLGRMLGMEQKSAWARIHGKIAWRYNELVTLARCLGVSVAELVQDAPPHP